MKLLGEKKVKEAKNKADGELRNRVNRLQDEETALARRVSDARDNEKRELDKIDEQLAQARIAHKSNVSFLKVEVDSLEERRRRALEPILEREQEAERALEILADRELGLQALEDNYEVQTNRQRNARSEYEKKRTALGKEDATLRKREAKVLEDWAELDRLYNARESMLRDEKQRLRDYFEAEDAKLKHKQ